MITFEILTFFISEYLNFEDMDKFILFLQKINAKKNNEHAKEEIDYLDEIKKILLEWKSNQKEQLGKKEIQTDLDFSKKRQAGGYYYIEESLITFIEKCQALEKYISGQEIQRGFILFQCREIDDKNVKVIKEFFDSYFDAFKFREGGIRKMYEPMKFEWKRMSSGQLAMLNIFSRFHSIKEKIKTKSVIIFIDEGELYLHAEWQKKILKSLLDALPEIFKDKQIQIILTSHTPFVLSDIPKENVIFLNKDENGKCIVVDGLKEKKQTFGANIHTLFSDSFFLEGGLIGEFAKGKIQEVIEYLNGHPKGRWKEINEKNNKEVQAIIDVIGEPILKMQLQKMIDSKRLQKIDEIDKIKEEISSLQNRLTVIENLR